LEVSSDQYREKAAECDRLAERAHFARIAARYRDLARRWREIAQHAEWLEREGTDSACQAVEVAPDPDLPAGGGKKRPRPRPGSKGSAKKPP